VDVSSIDKNKDGKVYQCTMCPDQLSDEAGNCEMCKMKLKEFSVEDAQKNLTKTEHKTSMSPSHQ